MSATAAALARRLRLLALVLTASAAVGTGSPAAAARPPTASGASQPNDPYFTSLGYSWVYKRTALAAAWSQTLGDPGTVIAVVDSGVDPTAPDLRGALLPGYDVFDQRPDTPDSLGHGTEVASLAAARTNNGLGIAGACGRCSILPVRVTDDGGAAPVRTIAAGIVWAADHGARVINVSLVVPQPADVLGSAVAYAERKGALVVAAAGNDGLGAPAYPAAYPGVISVEAATSTDAPYRFSNHGGAVTLSAPGCAVAATLGGNYAPACGTSVSAPLVAGAAGLLAASYPAASADQIASALEQGADRVGDSRYGGLDVAQSLRLLGRMLRQHAR